MEAAKQAPPSEPLWLDAAVQRITIDRPVIVLGKGPGLARVPRSISRTHHVVGINQSLAAVEHAHAVFALDVHHMCHVMFDPALRDRWDHFFVPDGICRRWDSLKVELPVGLNDFRPLDVHRRPGWMYERMRYEDVDRIIDFGRFGDRIVRYRVWDTALTENPVDPETFQRWAEGADLLKNHTNSAHMAFHYLRRQGVTEVLTAGMGDQVGYADLGFDIEFIDDQGYVSGRWSRTCEVLEALGIRHRRLEDMGVDELAALSPA